MKKVISIVLALLMMIPMAAMLVPTASAATVGESYTPPVPEETWVYYEQDFSNAAYAGKTDSDLATALGWSKPSQYATLQLTDDGQLRVVSQYSAAGNSKPTANDWGGGGYITTLFQNDPRMATSVLVLEYDLTYQKRTAGEENDIKVSDTKTVKADGQGTYQFATLGVKGSSGYVYSRVNLAGDVAWNNNMDITPKGGSRTWGGATLKKINSVPGTTKVSGFEFYNENKYNESTYGTYTSTVVDMKLHIKYIFDPVFGNIYMYVNDVFVAVTSDQHRGDLAKWSRDYYQGTSSVFLQTQCGIDALIDNIKVWGYKANQVPALVVSEVAINGQGTSSNEGSYASGVYTGDYQWVELYNPSDKAVNIYDYSLTLDTAPFNLGTNGQEQELGSSAWHKADKYSSIGYFRSGDQTFTTANGTETTFTNPAYAEGILEPGKTALVLLPSTGLKANLPVDNDTIRAYFTAKDAPADTPIFVVDNKSDKKFEMTLDQANVFAIMKVNNPDTDDVVAVGYNKNTTYTWYYESYCIITPKGGGSGSVWLGYSVKDALGEFPVTAEGNRVTGATTTTKSASFEISYFDWNYAGSVTNFGFMRYNTTVTRTGIKGTLVDETPGFVPVECRAPVALTVTDVDGNKTTEIARFQDAYAVPTPIVPGYDTRVFVNGELAVAKAEAETTNVTINGYADIKVELYREGPAFIGYQTTAVDEDDCYDLRLLAAVNSFDYEALGFRVAFYDGIDESNTLECEVQYVYTDVTATYADDSTEVINAQEDFKSNYLYALHIKDIDAASTWDIKVEAIYMVDGEWQTGSVNVGDGEFFTIELN